FLSSQAQPRAEYLDMTSMLKAFHGTVVFDSQATAGQHIDRILQDQRAGRPTTDLVTLTYSDLLTLHERNALEDLTPLLRRLRAGGRRFPPALLADGTFGTGSQFAIPWLQATYLMVV